MRAELSFFSAITKYQSSLFAEPRENRLTEVFAAVLRETDSDLATELVEYWFDSETVESETGERLGTMRPRTLKEGEQPSVRTQRTLNTRFVDLELDFHDSTEMHRRSQIIRIEVKHGVRPENGQVMAYEERVDGVPRVPVVILAPSKDLPFEDSIEAPETATQRSWEGTHRFVQNFTAKSEVDSWLVDRLLDFLDEEGLAPLPRMTKKHTSALAVSRQANAVLEVLIAGAQRQVKVGWGENEALQSGGKGSGSFKHYPPSNDDPWSLPAGAWREFKTTSGINFNSPDGPTGDVIFIAGVAWKAQSLVDLSESSLARLLGLGFFEFKEGGCSRLMRASTPDDFLEAGRGEGVTLELQGRALGHWVVDAFETIDRELRSQE